MATLDEVDPTFLDDLRRSDPSVWAVAGWLRESQGIPVIVSPRRERDKAENRAEYADVDLQIIFGVEVKQRLEIDFKSKAEFPYATVIVDVKDLFDKKPGKTYAYFICNQSLTGALLVSVKETRDRWIQTKRLDSRIGRERDYYECPVALCSYVDLAVRR